MALRRPRRLRVALVTRHAKAWGLAALIVLLAGVNLLYTARAVSESNHKFCGVVTAITSRPVPRPADPKANPSRATSYEWYLRFVRLGRDLGC